MKTQAPKIKYKLSDHPGAGCYLSPPAHPRYFVRSVYNVHGNELHYDNAPQYFLEWEGREHWFTALEDADKFFKPLPLNHARVGAWIKHEYQHLAHCYRDTTREKYGRPETLVYPPSNMEFISAGIIEPERDPECMVECFNQRRAKWLKQGKAQLEKWKAIAIPENHLAVISIREHYPNYAPELDLIAHPPTLRGSWYATMNERPTAEECPGDFRVGLKHNSREWCQLCGRDNIATNATVK